jgi:hypothetical protein
MASIEAMAKAISEYTALNDALYTEPGAENEGIAAWSENRMTEVKFSESKIGYFVLKFLRINEWRRVRDSNPR